MVVCTQKTLSINSTIKKICFLNTKQQTIKIKLAPITHAGENEINSMTLICGGVTDVITVTEIQPQESVEIFTLYSGIESQNPEDIVKKHDKQWYLTSHAQNDNSIEHYTLFD
jgi:hypothetical protein